MHKYVLECVSQPHQDFVTSILTRCLSILAMAQCVLFSYYAKTFPDEEFYKYILVKCSCTDISIMQNFDYLDIISALTSDVLICFSCILAGTVLGM